MPSLYVHIVGQKVKLKMSNTNELINYYIYEYFDLSIDNEINIKCLLDGKVMTYSEFRMHLKLMFAYDSIHLVKEWYDEKLKVKLGTFYEYMDKCRVSLGSTTWVVYDNFGMQVTTQKLFELFGSEISQPIINSYYDKWYDAAVINHTEKIMGFNL
jgi:hypothetical protein